MIDSNIMNPHLNVYFPGFFFVVSTLFVSFSYDYFHILTITHLIAGLQAMLIDMCSPSVSFYQMFQLGFHLPPGVVHDNLMSIGIYTHNFAL